MNLTLVDGYDRTKNPRSIQFRTMTIDEAKELCPGSRVWATCNDGKARQVTINGRPKTWKRSPERVEVPVKFGLYETVRFNAAEIVNGRLLVEIG